MVTLLAFVAMGIATLVLLSYVIFIWWLDRYEREPLWMVGLVFLWGALGGTFLACITNDILSAIAGLIFDPSMVKPLTTVVIAPPVEELTKGAILIVLLLSHHFDNETDGLIYGAAAGLGFATVENIWYFANAMMGEKAVFVLFFMIVMRTFFTAVMHCISTSLLGLSIGYARHRSGAARWVIYPAIGYALAVGNHMLWNGLLVFSGTFEGGATLLVQLLGCGFVVLASAVLFGLTQWSLKREHDIIREKLGEEAARGVLPEEHAEIIPYWTKRRRDDWVPARINKGEYIRLATLLAFRKHQRELADEVRGQSYTEDIRNYREQIRRMLGR